MSAVYETLYKIGQIDVLVAELIPPRPGLVKGKPVNAVPLTEAAGKIGIRFSALLGMIKRGELLAVIHENQYYISPYAVEGLKARQFDNQDEIGSLGYHDHNSREVDGINFHQKEVHIL